MVEINLVFKLMLLKIYHLIRLVIDTIQIVMSCDFLRAWYDHSFYWINHLLSLKKYAFFAFCFSRFKYNSPSVCIICLCYVVWRWCYCWNCINWEGHLYLYKSFFIVLWFWRKKYVGYEIFSPKKYIWVWVVVKMGIGIFDLNHHMLCKM